MQRRAELGTHPITRTPGRAAFSRAACSTSCSSHDIGGCVQICLALDQSIDTRPYSAKEGSRYPVMLQGWMTVESCMLYVFGQSGKRPCMPSLLRHKGTAAARPAQPSRAMAAVYIV